MVKSAVLRAEIEYVKTNGQDVVVKFHNGSTIKVFTANDNARGIRSNVAIREEFRQIKKILKIMSFLHFRWYVSQVIYSFHNIRMIQF